MSAANDKEPWTDADRDRLAAMSFAVPKPSIEEMATTLARTPGSCFGEIFRLGMAKTGAQLRACIPCKRPFFSGHIGNRICRRCVRNHQLECA